jgi:hypothetical protein
VPGISASDPSGSGAVVDRIQKHRQWPVLAIMVVAVGVSAYVYAADVSRLWLFIGSIGGGAVTLLIFALAGAPRGRAESTSTERSGGRATAS